jgi:two-component sensor histidine kinase
MRTRARKPRGAALEGRIKSMATTHELLSSRHWQGIPLAELVRSELAPYVTADNTRIDGPDVVLTAEAGQTLAMVFHELATNAAKFGALSVGSGRLAVRWNVWNVAQNGGSQSRLCIRDARSKDDRASSSQQAAEHQRGQARPLSTAGPSH